MKPARRSRIRIYRRIEKRNPLGETIWTYVENCKCWAQWKDDTTLTIRYLKDVWPGDMVAIGGDDHLEIISVKDILQPTRLVELGVRKTLAGLGPRPARPRGIATSGFRGFRDQHGEKGHSP